MFYRTLLGVLTLLAGAVVLSTFAGCTCSSPHPMECYEADDCAGRDWTKSLCSEDEGRWECEYNRCVGKCNPMCQIDSDCDDKTWPEFMVGCPQQGGYWTCHNSMCTAHCDGPQCTDASDCSDRTWPADAGCDEADGAWECSHGFCNAVCQGECSTATDCSGKAWPGGVPCEEADGYWDCTAGQCVAACNPECTRDSDCAAFDWNQPCVGNWDCNQGRCEPVCDPVSCGDGNCAVAAGETRDSCSADCKTPCSDDADCVNSGDVWEPPCAGRWECSGVCDPLCDYSTCGDGTCDASAGEDAVSCPADCLDHCQWPSDCVYEKWSKICQGRHTCFMGQCQQTCDSNGCGNGTCDDALGETSDSCFIDCLGGPCDTTVDCLGYRWYEKNCTGGGGHWACSHPANACEAVCDNSTCGDGNCDVLGGESATGCPADCQQYDCNVSADCSGLTLPQGCSDWLCVRRNCTPVCP